MTDRIGNQVVDCDVFCLNDFDYDGDIVISGNFYSAAAVSANSIQTGEDIIINTPDIVIAESLLAFGKIEIEAAFLDAYDIYAEESFDFYLYDGPGACRDFSCNYEPDYCPCGPYDYDDILRQTPCSDTSKDEIRP